MQKDAQALATLSGVLNFEQKNDTIRFSVQHQDLSAVTAELAKYGLIDLKVAMPTLEELFMAYYRDESEEEHAK